jgi:hypothetical protein
MTPTLEGRLQTRLFLAVTVGVLWTAIIAPFLPEPAGVSVSMSYAMAFGSLLLMTATGMIWENVYHGLQQRRWDKDWPSVFVLLTVLNEAPVVWLLDHLFPVMSGPMAGMSGSTVASAGSLGLASPYLPGFAIHIGTTWAVMWLFSQGPMRVICIRWRFEGGRVVYPRLLDSPVPGGRPELPWPEGNGTSGALVPEAVPGAAAARLTLQAGIGQAQPNGTPASASPGDLVEGGICSHGHFGYPGLRYCMICGRLLPSLTGTRGHGRRPPLGILIFEDGATHVVDSDVRLAHAEGPGYLTAGRRDEIPAASALAELRLAGWQPVVSSEFHRIAIALPGGGYLHVAPGVPARLMPGAEFTVATRRIRYESPYQPAELDLTTLGPHTGTVPGTDAATSLAAAAPPPLGDSAPSAHPPRLAAPTAQVSPGQSTHSATAPDSQAAGLSAHYKV